MRRIIIALAATCAISCAGSSGARDLQQVLNTDTLRVGVALFAPWAARRPDGELVGFEIDVAKQLATDLGVKLVTLTYDVERLIPALESGEIDLIAAGLAITPERALHLNFSVPYATMGITLATNIERTAAVKDLQTLNDPAYTIAAVEGSVAAELARRTLPRAKLATFPSATAASAALIAGEAHGYLDDEPVPTFLALEHPGVVDLPLQGPLLATRTAFGVAKGDADFLAYLNAWITAHEDDTWLPTTENYWFKSLSWRERLDAPRTRAR